MGIKRYHIIIDLNHIDNEYLNQERLLSQFLKDFPGIIDMHPLIDPVIAEGVPENPGLSGFVIIDYSHISIHTFTDYQQALVDIFSCKPFSKQEAVQAVLSFFQADSSQAKIQKVSWG